MEPGIIYSDESLLSPTSYNEGHSVPGIAHGVIFRNCVEGGRQYGLH